MERVTFLVERSGERIECMLNPETFTITRQAGLQPQRTLSGVLTGTAEADNPVLATGGGVTELVLELLFDVGKQPNAQPDDSVQTLTAPLWEMSENSESTNGYGSPPMIRFVWGKAWNIPAIVVSVAERFEQFTASGIPRRSWVKMRLLRCNTTVTPAEDRDLATFNNERAVVPENVLPEDLQTHEVQGDRSGPDGGGLVERLDQLAHRYYGDASQWPVLAAFNDVDDPARLPAGTALMVPPLASPR
jgi:hypothetical protein